MKTILIIVCIGLAAALLGWVTFHKSDTRATVSIETQQIEKDSQKAVQKGKELLKKLEEARPPGKFASQEESEERTGTTERSERSEDQDHAQSKSPE